VINNASIIAEWSADMYEKFETETEDVNYLLSVLSSKQKHILEIACGSGRFLIPLAKAGYTVVGLDFDANMLSKIQNKAEGLNNIKWYKTDVIAEKWGSDFDVVVLAGNVLLNIVTEMDYTEAQEMLIFKASDVLASGGMIYIDYGYTLHPENLFNNPNEQIIWEGTDSHGIKGRMLLLKSTFNKVNGICKYTRRFELTLPDGSHIRKDIPSLKHFAKIDQIHSWLSSAGFIVYEEYGDYNYHPISESTNRAIICAKKR